MKSGPSCFERGAAERGLAGPDLAGDLDEPLALADAEEQVVERLAMPVAEEQRKRGSGVMLNGASRKP